MINMDQFSLLDILPESLKRSADNEAMAAAITAMLKKIHSKTAFVNPLQPIPEILLDILAVEEHVDFYEKTLSVKQKRDLINNSFFFHQKKGTPAAVEQLIEIVFGEGKVEEWFEYGGVPGYFKVITSNKAVTNELAAQFTKALESVTRLGARLEKVEIPQVEEMSLYVGAITHTGDKMTLRQVT